MARLFGTNGIRGVFGREMTLDLALDVSYALATYFDGPVLVGYDGRHSSIALSKVVRAGLNSLGLDVRNAGLVPTPCLQYCTKKLGYSGAVMITASHNPPEYNGIKVMASDGVELSRQEELKVEEIYFGRGFKSSSGIGDDAAEENAVQTYLDGVRSLVDTNLIRARNFNVVLDLGNGAQANAAPKLLESLGCSVVTINSAIDGSFPGRGSEPTTENLSALSSAVRENSADLGIAYDGDGDRSIFCDEQGNIYGGDKSAAVMLDYILAKNAGGKVVAPINSSALIDVIAAKWNASVIRTKVGSVEVSRKMLEDSALIGLEENGGFMYGRHMAVRDGAMSSALMLEAIASRPSRLSQLVDAFPKFHQHKTKFACNREQSSRVMEKLAGSAGSRIETLDGVKVWLNDNTWVMVRQSGTEPVMRLYAESSDSNILQETAQKYTSLINEIIKG